MRRILLGALAALALLAPAAAFALEPPSGGESTSASEPTSTDSPSDTPTDTPTVTDTPTGEPTSAAPTHQPTQQPARAPGLIVTSGYRFLRSPVHAYVAGDSLTQWGSPELAAMKPSWSINGVAGRRVEDLPRLIRGILAVDAHPRLVVVALGSNPSAGWTRGDYARAVARLPASTRVEYVTTYIAPWSHKAPSSKVVTRRYAAWMDQLAQARPHTCAAPWAVVASRHQSWLIDGLHETTLGYFMRAQLIVRTADACS